MRLLVDVIHRQAVLFVTHHDNDQRVATVAFNLKLEGQRLVSILNAADMVERAIQIDLGRQQAKGFIRQGELVHAACPPLFGSNGAGRLLRGTSLGLRL